MAIVLTVTSAWVYQRQDAGYQQSILAQLRDRSADARKTIEMTRDDARLDAVADALVRADAGSIQVFDDAGDVVATSADFPDVAVVSDRQIAASTAAGSTYRVNTRSRRDHMVRVLLTRVRDRGIVIAVIESEVPSHEALERLAAQLVAGALIAVLLGSLLAFGLARAALRPVERLGVEAEEHGRDGTGVALAVPTSRDEIARLAVRLNGLLARMHDATVRERRFVAEAGHELRTPLANMLAEIELALETPDGLEVEELLHSLHEEALRIAMLAEQLLGQATIGDADVVEPVDVVAVVTGRVDRLRQLYPTRTFDMQLESVDLVDADPGRIAQAVDNLLDNAVVHGGSVITVRVVEARDDVGVHVLDDGPGIEPTVAERAFERFARADEARSRRGSGLGLSIVRAIAEANGGAAGIAPRADRPGTDAWFTIARRHAPHADATDVEGA